MGARLVAGGPTRLDEAVSKVAALIDSLGKDQSLMLVAAGAAPRRLTGFTNDRRELRAALNGLSAEAAGADLGAALRLLAAAARATPFPTALLISDGNVPAAVDAELPFSLDYQRLPPATVNLGLTACAARRTSEGRWEVAVQVEGASGAARGANVRLEEGATLLSERPVAPGPNGTDRLSFLIDAAIVHDVTVRLVPDDFDALASDDVAYLHLPALRPLAVWVDPQLTGWKRALAAQPAVVFVEQDADLVVGTKPTDLARSAAVRVLTGGVPTDLIGLFTVADEGGSVIVDRRGGDPLLAHVGLADLVISERVAWAPGADEAAVEARGWRVLIHGDRGPLALTGSTGADQLVAFSFKTDRSTLPYRLAFPVLAGNLVDQARRRRGQAEAATRATGTGSLGGLVPSTIAVVTAPDGTTQSLSADAAGIAAGLRCPLPGFYHVANGPVVGAALLDPFETSLAVSERLQLKEVAVATSTTTPPADLPLWRWLALIALLILVFDWWYAHRDPRQNLTKP